MRLSSVVPLTAERWSDFEAVMGAKGGCGGCWCMLWRLTRRAYDQQAGDGNRQAMHALVTSGQVPGLLAYHGDRPIGWLSLAPRDQFPRLATSRVLKPVDDRAVWSVTCMLVARPCRRRGVGTRLLEAACEAVRRRDGVIEGYPIAPTKTPYPPVYAWTGFEPMFRRAGFEEVARRSPTRPIMRQVFRSGPGGAG